MTFARRAFFALDNADHAWAFVWATRATKLDRGGFLPVGSCLERHIGSIPGQFGGKQGSYFAGEAAVKVEQHRATRHKFVARVEVVDLDSEKQLIARTGNLSTFGCFIETATPFARGARIRMRLNHRGATFVAIGQVVDARPTGMGVRFVTIEPAHQQMLENWLGQLRNGGQS